MRKLSLSFFLLLLAFAVSFAISQKCYQQAHLSETKNTVSTPSFALKKRSFTVVVVGYNNGATVGKTVSSILSQAYENFRLLYIDDASTDGSGEVARDCIDERSWLSHVTFVKNEEHLGLLANVYRAALACPDDEIILFLRGEDWLAHEWVLERLNLYYEDPNLWISLAQGIDYPSYTYTPLAQIGRDSQEMRSHLKSFYAALLKRVRETDLIYAGAFLPACAELGLMTPMLEMAKEHFQLIPEVLFVHNGLVEQEEEAALVQRCEKFISSREPYAPLTMLVNPCGD